MQTSNERPAAPTLAAYERSELATGAGAAEPSGVASAAHAPAGAPSSNTAPANRIAHVLRSGLDSLYLSAKGQISEETQQTLDDLKARAQDAAESVQTTAQLPLGKHLFCVLDRGRRKFAYVIEDNWFSIGIGKRGNTSLPMAHAQISSEALTGCGALACADTLLEVLHQLGTVNSDLTVSRADLFADFTTTADLAANLPTAWISRSRKRARYDEGERFTGLAFGMGGMISARLYDKSFEILRSDKTYLRDLWRAAGWDGACPVWRMEFQVKRTALPPQLTTSVPVFVEALPMIWTYLLNEWLRLSVPNQNDDSRERWATHPLWQVLALIHPHSEAMSVRAPLCRVPSDKTLFTNGMGALSSFMAREGITDWSHGLGEFVRQAERFHARGKADEGEQLAAYLKRKTLAKGRRFNTMRTNHEES